MSLRLRLLLTLAPLFVAGLLISDVITYTSLKTYLFARVDQQLVTGHQQVETYLTNLAFGRDRGAATRQSPVPMGAFGELVASDGTVLAATLPVDSLSAYPNLPRTLPPAGADGYHLFTVPATSGSGQYRVYVDQAHEGAGTLLAVAIPLDDVQATLAQVQQLEAIITGGLVVVVIGATWILVRRGLRPLERMGTTARAIVASDLSRRVTPATESTEVGRLGLALNSMLAQLEQAFGEIRANEQRLRHFISDASHELRTPLTSMRGYAELLRRTPDMEREDVLLAVRRVEEETTRMGVLVEDLVLLARLDQGRPLERQPVDIVPLVLDCCSDARAAHPERTITVAGDSAHTEMIVGDDMRLRQALSNLIRNALVHTPPGTPVTVRVHELDGDAIVDIIDQGPGIPQGESEHIFERFYRADPERSGDQGGSGLGLSIVAAIVTAHGGSVRAGDTPGGGATFRVRLPVIPPPGAETAVAFPQP
jgi:two-component system OmpR family sensor kinase